MEAHWEWAVFAPLVVGDGDECPVSCPGNFTPGKNFQDTLNWKPVLESILRKPV
jgi:hypothetical protein